MNTNSIGPIIAVVATVGLLVWFLFFRKKTEEVVEMPDPTPSSPPPTGNGNGNNTPSCTEITDAEFNVRKRLLRDDLETQLNNNTGDYDGDYYYNTYRVPALVDQIPDTRPAIISYGLWQQAYKDLVEKQGFCAID